MFCWQDLLQSWVVAGTKLSSTNISIGKLKRELTVAERDTARDAIYFGTTSGDVIKVCVLCRFLKFVTIGEL